MARAAAQAVQVPDEVFERGIYLIRGMKVMLDSDLARLYGVTTGNLNLAVRRNAARFPPDFMFQLTKEELQNLILQFARSSWGGPTADAVCLYGTWSCDAFGSPAQSACGR